MATVQHYVDTDVAPGGDGSSGNPFASLSEWESTVGASNSATDDYIVDCAGVAADTTGVTVDFGTNITTGSITIRGNRSDPAGFYDGNLTISDQHYRLDVGNVTICLALAEANITVDGIQCVHAHGASFRAAILFQNPTNNGFTIVRNCRVLNTGAVDFGIGPSTNIGGTGHTRTIENNLVVGFDVAQISLNTSPHVTHTWNVYHNTCYGDGSAVGIYIRSLAGSGSPVFNVFANAIANCGTDISTTDQAVGTLNRADNASEAGGVDILISSAAAAWTSPGTLATSDFTVKDTSSPLYNAVNPTLLTTDITGFTRDGTNHDAGAFEFQGGGGGYTLQAGEGSFELTGQNVTLAAARKLAVAHGSLAFTGQNVSLRAARKLIAGHGSFALTGQDVTLTFSGQAPTLTAETGQFTLSGQAVVLRAARKLSADAGVFALSGQDVDFLTGKTLTAGHGVFALTGQAVGFKFTRALKAETGVFALTGRNVNLTYSQVGVAEVHGGGWGLTYSQHLKLLARLKKKDESSPRTKLSWSSKPTSSYQNQCRKKSRRLPPPCSWAMGRSSALQRSCPRESARLLLQSSTLISSMNKSERTRKSYC